MRHVSFLASRMLLATGVALAALIVFIPKDTHADDSNEVSDWERQGEYTTDDEGNFKGQKFGDVLVKGEMKSTASGWVLVRTYENTSDEPTTVTVEEKLSRQMTAHFARVSPPAVTLILRTQKIALKGHEKKSIGISLPPEMSQEMDKNARIEAVIKREEERAAADETGEHPMNIALVNQTYMAFNVGYLSPLPPGKRAARDPNYGVTRPQGLEEIVPPVSPIAVSGAVAVKPSDDLGVAF